MHSIVGYLQTLFDPSGFVPRAVCGSWTTWEVALNNVSDGLIAVAYTLIPLILVYFVRRRKDLPYFWVFWVFSAFILTCGSTHVLEVVLFYYPVYHLAGWLKALTALASWVAVGVLIKILPSLLALRSPSELQALNAQLAQEVEQRRAAEAALVEKNQRLEASERLKDEFLANVSHELRTPLTLILSPVEFLLSRPGESLTSQQSQSLELVRANSLRLLDRVNDLLDFSRYQAGRLEVHREPTAAVAFTSSLVEAFRNSAVQKKVELLFLAEPEWGALLDRYLYERIVFNLLSNACKHCQAGDGIEVSLRRLDNHLHLQVVDSGAGISAEDLPIIFDRFRQAETQARQPGSGLGLALVREFASTLGGEVSVQSELGQGSTFSLRIFAPVCGLPGQTAAWERRDVPRLVPLEFDAPVSSEALAEVLLAEDDPELASYLSVVLRGLCNVTTVRDGLQALVHLEERQPQLILSDVMMPGLDGFALCRRVKSRQEWRNIPFVLLTAQTHREALLTGWEAGADEYLFKPFHPAELITRVRSLLAGAASRQQLERALQAANQQLELRVDAALRQAEAARSAKTLFLGNLSHELRTPLTSVVGLVELAAGESEPEKLAGTLALIRKSAHGLNFLLDDLIEYIRLESTAEAVVREPFQLEGLLRSIHENLLVQAAEKGLQFRLQTRFSPERDQSLGDSRRLRHVLVKLVVNAIKFTSEGGVTLRAEEDGNDCVHFSVADTGVGIAPDQQELIFEPFTQVDDSLSKSHQGIGLGLAVAHRLIAHLGGNLSVQSQPGAGSIFAFSLALPAMAAHARPGAVPLQELAGRNVLLIEDHPLNRNVLKLLLERAGLRVVAVETGCAGLDAFVSQVFDIVLVDLQLPDLDGLEVARKMRIINRDVPLLALTAHAGDYYREQALAAGCRDFLTKPVELEDLLQAFAAIWGP